MYSQLAALGVYDWASSLHFYAGHFPLFWLQPYHSSRSVGAPPWVLGVPSTVAAKFLKSPNSPNTGCVVLSGVDLRASDELLEICGYTIRLAGTPIVENNKLPNHVFLQIHQV